MTSRRWPIPMVRVLVKYAVMGCQDFVVSGDCAWPICSRRHPAYAWHAAADLFCPKAQPTITFAGQIPGTHGDALDRMSCFLG